MENKEKCPYNKPVLQWVLRLGMMVLGTVGLIFLNLWVSVAYLIYYAVFFFLAMPLKHCQYCYYKVKETTIDRKNGKTIVKLLPKDKWKESYLKKHIACGKKWGFNFIIIWFFPIVGIVISFFLSFSIVALLSLIGFIVMLAVMFIHMKWKVCPTCAIMDECHAAF
jgi:disulfide bond formation protein DsbB